MIYIVKYNERKLAFAVLTKYSQDNSVQLDQDHLMLYFFSFLGEAGETKEGVNSSVVLWQGVAKVPGILSQRQLVLTNLLCEASLFRTPAWSVSLLIYFLHPQIGGEISLCVTQVKGRKFVIECHHEPTISAPGQIALPSPLKQPLACHPGSWPSSAAQHCLYWRVGNTHGLTLWITSKGNWKHFDHYLAFESCSHLLVTGGIRLRSGPDRGAPLFNAANSKVSVCCEWHLALNRHLINIH